MKRYDYIIVGAGPAGLQMGHHLDRAGRSYVVLEGSDSAGSFFKTHPRHRTLMSLNKRFNYYEEPDFNMRHDWNSLLSDDPELVFTRYSDELYPSADDLVRYMQDYADKLEIDVRYETRVASVRREDDHDFVVTDASGGEWRCRCLLMATGAATPRVPHDIEGVELADTYEEHDIDPRSYENQRVAIVGRGNSAFEVANHLAGHAAFVHLLVGEPVKHAWQTHFVGDLRAINNTIIDMYQLKSLHATLGFRARKITKNADGSLSVTVEEDLPHWETPRTSRTTVEYDRVILCTGWNFTTPSLFADDCRPEMLREGKFPVLNGMWETTVPDLFYIGSAMQARDRKSASGFIHGFRYNVRSLFSLLEQRYFGEDLPARDFTHAELLDLSKYLVERVSTVSSLYQMNGVLCDVIAFTPEGAKVYEELPVEHVHGEPCFIDCEQIVTVTLEYGFHRYPEGSRAVEFIHPSDAFDPSCSAFLHPVMRCYEDGRLVDELHLGESLVVRYDHYDYAENCADTHLHAVFNFLNGFRKVSDEVLPEDVFAPERIDEILAAWPEGRELPARRQPSCHR